MHKESDLSFSTKILMKNSSFAAAVFLLESSVAVGYDIVNRMHHYQSSKDLHADGIGS